MPDRKITPPKRGRPELPPELKQDPKAKRSFYQPLEDYDLFFAFCKGDISRDLPKLMALWMAVCAETREAVAKVVVKGKPLMQATEELKAILPDILLDEVLSTQIRDLPREQKMALLGGQTVLLPATEKVKGRRGGRG